MRMEVYSPDYLSGGGRPVITDAPASVTYGQGFPVHLLDDADLSSVSFIRLSAVTHCFNMGQRHVALDFTRGDPDGFQMTAPADAQLAPPGHYMLFVLNGDGVPAVAPIVQLVAV
jgi:hypothetical protein